MSGGGSRAAARALISGMPRVGGDSIMSSSSQRMLASEMERGIGVSFNGVTGMGSAATQLRVVTSANIFLLLAYLITGCLGVETRQPECIAPKQ